MQHHSRVIKFKFLGATDHKPSRVSISDVWHSERVELSLSGADMWVTIKEFLESKDLTILNYGWLDTQTNSGVVLVKEFDIHIKPIDGFSA